MKSRIATLALLSIAAASSLAAAPRSFTATVTGQGQPMILVPGLACPGQVWDDAVARLQSRYQCHVISIAGFGGVPAHTPSDAFLDTVASDLAAYIDEHQLTQPILVGHSLGGFLALKIAIKRPDALGPLVIVDSLPFLPAAMNPAATAESMQAMASQQRDGMRSGGMPPEAARQMLAMMVTDPANIERAANWSLASDPATVAQAMYELNTTDLRPLVSKIQNPTLVLGAWIAYQPFGSTKESTAAIFDAQYQTVPNYHLVMSDKARHFIMLDDPEFFHSQLDSFLASKP